MDTSEEAVRARATELGGAANLTMTDDLSRPIRERLDIFETFVAARAGLKALPAKEILAEAVRLDCKERGIFVLADRLLGSGNEIVPRLTTYQALFQRVRYAGWGSILLYQRGAFSFSSSSSSSFFFVFFFTAVFLVYLREP